VPDCELFHATEHLLLPLRRCPTVLTVHDLIFHLFPQHHKPLNRWYLNAALPLYCRRASAIICVSERTKSDLVGAWRVDPAKVHVVYEAPDEIFQPAAPAQVADVRRRYGLPERYLLTVGTIEPRKNLTRLVEALELLRLSCEDARLVVVGSTGWLYKDFYDRLARSEHRSAVLLTGFVPNVDLPAVYSGAIATVFPSLYEGFGLPVLESMACGTPVVTSQAASLPELGGDAALYFDPQDVPGMAAALQQVWCDPELCHSMRAQGLIRAARFSWARAAQETLRVYESVGVRIGCNGAV
jgi:glycosyltransferase involved in cell wall biosynthesis